MVHVIFISIIILSITATIFLTIRIHNARKEIFKLLDIFEKYSVFKIRQCKTENEVLEVKQKLDSSLNFISKLFNYLVYSLKPIHKLIVNYNEDIKEIYNWEKEIYNWEKENEI